MSKSISLFFLERLSMLLFILSITIEVLDEGLLDELNMLNQKIEDLSLKKGEIQQS